MTDFQIYNILESYDNTYHAYIKMMETENLLTENVIYMEAVFPKLLNLGSNVL